MPGEDVTDPFVITSPGTTSYASSGWTTSSGEALLGAGGNGAFWFKITAPSRTTIDITNTSPASFMMYAYSVANPALPVDTTNLAEIASGVVLSLMISTDLYVMVDVVSVGGDVPFTFAFTSPPPGSIFLYVASDIGGSTTEARVNTTPASISANVTGTSDVVSFDVLFDGDEIMSGLVLPADNTWSGFISLPGKNAGDYPLKVFGHGPDVDSNIVTVTVLHSPIGLPVDPDDATAQVPSSAVGRWLFVDPASETNYAFPMNPSTASSTNSPRNHSVESTTRPTSFIVYEGSLGAKQYTFGGVLLDEDMYRNLASWSRLNRRIWLVDHNLVAWQVVPQKFDVVPRTNRLNPWVQDYQFTVLLLKGPTMAEVV